MFYQIAPIVIRPEGGILFYFTGIDKIKPNQLNEKGEFGIAKSTLPFRNGGGSPGYHPIDVAIASNLDSRLAVSFYALLLLQSRPYLWLREGKVHSFLIRPALNGPKQFSKEFSLDSQEDKLPPLTSTVSFIYGLELGSFLFAVELHDSLVFFFIDEADCGIALVPSWHGPRDVFARLFIPRTGKN